ncbi:MAG TPA: tetratricopeptide repeat protein [Planctomycetota bacterium]
MSKNSLTLIFALGAATAAGCTAPRTVGAAPGPAREPVFAGMGAHGREITTASPQAQAYFDQGLAWMYAFNHDEAIRSFEQAAEFDPGCAMAWWGVAVCHGPNYNDPVMTPERSAAAWAALQQAQARTAGAAPVERALIEALASRYADPAPQDRSGLERAYADAMAGVWAAFPHDSDVGTLYAESMMVQRPWKLYSPDQVPEGDTPVILAVLEQVMEMDPGNPGANHLYVHAVEPSKDPGRAIAAADRLREQVPGSGHLDHMPSHIYVQVGQWDKSITQNAKAMAADAVYRKLAPELGLQHMYMVHNAHMLAYSAMMVGREKEAMAAARSMWETVPPETLEAFGGFVDLWFTSVYDVQKRFGRWDAILAEPAPPAFLPITSAVWRAHRAIAYAAKHDFAAAEREHAAFRAAKAALPEDSVFGGDPIDTILEVSDLFLSGEIALQKGDWNEAARFLREATVVEDSLGYGEPPQWLQPTRHTLGAVYLESGRFADAEKVYREDLVIWPGNGWSLFGLSRALEEQGKTEEAGRVKAQFRQAWAKADEATSTSCKCLLET